MPHRKLVTCVESHASTMSLLKSGEYHCIKAINNNKTFFFYIIHVVQNYFLYVCETCREYEISTN